MIESPFRLPGIHSLFWKLAFLLIGFCLLMIWLSLTWGHYAEKRNAYLSEEARSVKRKRLVGVIGGDLQSLSSYPLSEGDSEHLTFLRGLDWPTSTRSRTTPWLKIPFPMDPTAGSLVIELPKRFVPGRYVLMWRVLINGVIPGAFTLLLCVGLYRLLIQPLNHLRAQANAWHAAQLTHRLSSQMISRQDELGELSRAFDQMAERLHSTVIVQQQLLRDMSHELRTPLSRLRVACESEQSLPALRGRLSREVDGMQRLVDDTLQLAWLDTERQQLPKEDIQVLALWEMLAENACFESGWPAAQLQCDLNADCWVRGHLNTLAQALENILRNAVRHSPPHGIVRLSGRRDGEFWQLWLDDQGNGVDERELERIFAPFTRLNGSRPGNGGFGLGLSIARNSLALQGGSLWAQNIEGGLRLNMRLLAKASVCSVSS